MPPLPPAIWIYSMTQSLRDKFQTTQYKIIRFVLNLDPRSRIENERFSRLGWLPFIKRVDFTTLCHVFNIHVNTAPSYMHENFTPINEIHHYGTRFRVTSNVPSPDSNLSFRNSRCFTIPGVKGFGQKSFSYKRISLWNSLPQHVRDSGNLKVFKTRLKIHMI